MVFDYDQFLFLEVEGLPLPFFMVMNGKRCFGGGHGWGCYVPSVRNYKKIRPRLELGVFHDTDLWCTRAAFKSVGALGPDLIWAPLNTPKKFCVTCIVPSTLLARIFMDMVAR